MFRVSGGGGDTKEYKAQHVHILKPDTTPLSGSQETEAEVLTQELKSRLDIPFID